MTTNTLQERRTDAGRLSNEELSGHAAQFGIDSSLIKVQDINAPDTVTITVGKPDGRSLRRVVPRECWEEPTYRSSLFENMALILA